MESRRWNACVATAHHLASQAGAKVLAEHGNAVDAAVAANLVLAVVLPYQCGLGGDLMAIVAHGDEAVGYRGCGRSAQAATIEAVRDALGTEGPMPRYGAHTVTVPGAVRGWFDLLERFGSRSFAALAAEAVAVARDGFPLSAAAAALIQRSKPLQDAAWQAIYGTAAGGANLRQPGLARTLQVLSEEGPESFYAGRIGDAIAGAVQAEGGLLSPADLSRHLGHWVAPLCAPYRDAEILELPPPSQGVGVLEALRIIESCGRLPPGDVDRHHLVIEAVKAAQADLRANVADPEVMQIDARDLLGDTWIDWRSSRLRMERATQPERGPASPGGTTYLTAADADGQMVSLIQSNYMGFGSGITVEGWGINLHYRGSDFVLEPAATNALGPARYTRHTLSPGLIRKDGHPWACLGTRGGDYQVPIGVQLITRLVDDRRSARAGAGRPSVDRWAGELDGWNGAGVRRACGRRVAGAGARGHQRKSRSRRSCPGDPGGRGRHVAAADPRTEGGVGGVPA